MPASAWPGSRIPYIDETGAPMVGAKLYFYDSGTTTPQPVYSDSALSTPIAQPVLADARGMFQRIFLNSDPGSYRVKLLDADDVLVFDDDDIAVAQTATYEPPETGATSESLLFRTGMLQPFYGTTAPSGWVRAAGRTIGSAASGASERANADCEALFLHLWAADSNLAVSGGRGATAAGDWAANKTIALPDVRDRAIIGLPAMGNSDAGLIADSILAAALGSTGGVSTVTLDLTQIPAHDHGGATGLAGAFDPKNGTYDRLMRVTGNNTAGGGTLDNSAIEPELSTSGVIQTAPNHTHTISSAGGGQAHSNVQPSIAVAIIIKL